jgi:phosphomannomutase
MARILHDIGQRCGIKFTDSEDALKIVFDPDGDRISFFEHGRHIQPDLVFLLLAERMACQRVVYDLRFSRAVRDQLEQLGIAGAVSRVGRLFLHEKMVKDGAEFGAETSGHFFFKEFHYLEMPELVMLRVLRVIKQEGRSLSQLVSFYQKYFKSSEISFPRDNQIIHKLVERYSDGKVSTLDGLTVEYYDWWFNIRPSNTEPVMRLIVEAKTKDLLVEKVRELRELIGKK